MIISFFLGISTSIIGSYIVKYLLERFYGKVRFSSILKAIDSLLVQFQSENFHPDFIVGIGRNGAVVASILSGHLGRRTILTTNLRDKWTQPNIRKTTIEASYMPSPEALHQKKILLVTCFVNSGSALKASYDHYLETTMKAPPAQIRTAAIFTTVDPIMKPELFVYEIGKNYRIPMYKIMRKLPWMRSGWILSIDQTSRKYNKAD